MHFQVPHRWDVTPAEAVQIQQQLRQRVIRETTFDHLDTVAGVDCGFKQDHVQAAVVVLDYESLHPIDQALARIPVTFPYVPGLLSFRETPAVLEALCNLQIQPDLLILDGHGYAHPRRFGLACHVGVITDYPTIGCAKSCLVGEYDALPEEAGHWVPLRDGDEIIGAVVRSRTGVSPIFVSIGHRVDLETAVRIVLHCCTRYRLPETTRYAHRLASGNPVELSCRPR